MFALKAEQSAPETGTNCISIVPGFSTGRSTSCNVSCSVFFVVVTFILLIFRFCSSRLATFIFRFIHVHFVCDSHPPYSFSLVT